MLHADNGLRVRGAAAVAATAAGWAGGAGRAMSACFAWVWCGVVWWPPGTTIVCDTSGEDPLCSDSTPFYEYSGADHTSYFDLNANGCSE